MKTPNKLGFFKGLDNGVRIVSAYRDAEGWVLFDDAENVIEKWPDDWPEIVDVKFLEHRGIKVA